MSRVRREVHIPWADLAAQFGSSMSNERRWRQQFRSALTVATRAYFAPLGEEFDSTVYVGEYDLGSRTRPGGLRLAPVSTEHRKLLGWGTRRSRRTSTRPAVSVPESPNRQESQPAPAAAPAKSTPEVVSIPAHAGVDITELHAHLDHNGLNASAVSDGALRSAIDTVLSRVTSVGNAQALVSSAITREPALLGITAPTYRSAIAPVPLVTLPKSTCPEHRGEILGKICRECAAELKAPDTTAAEAQACWDAVSARLKNLTTVGFDTTDEMARYQSLAIARGVTLSI